MNKTLLAIAFAGGIAVAAGCWTLWPQATEERSAAALMDAVMWNKEPVGGPFALVDHNGQRRTEADFHGKFLVIYFGFTFCSDVCPIDLQAIAAMVDKLGPDGDAVQPLFITVDPEKDTPEQLKRHVALFHPRLIGLTGNPRQVRQVALAYKVYYAKTEPTKKAGYEIDHTGFIFLVDAGGKYVGFLPPGTPPDRLVDVVRPHLAAMAQP